jgi:hypothetical protein
MQADRAAFADQPPAARKFSAVCVLPLLDEFYNNPTQRGPNMRKNFPAALALASLISTGALIIGAQAGPLPASTALVVDGALTSIQRVGAVCGANGCAVVQTKQVRHYYKPGTPKSLTGQHI